MTTDTKQAQQLAAKIERATQKRSQLVETLGLIDRELERRAKQTSIYGILDEVSEKIGTLHRLGAGKLFWGDKYTSEDEHLKHVNALRSTAKSFNDKIEVIHNKRALLEKEIEDVGNEIGYLNDELADQKELEEERKHDFVIKREFQPLPYRPMLMPWYQKGDDEKRFRKYLLLSLSFSILLGILVPMWQVPIPDKDEEVIIPERFAKLLKKVEPKPKPEPKKEPELKVDEKKPADKKPEEVKPVEPKPQEPKPVVKEASNVPKKVTNVGVLAFKDKFADLIDDTPDAKLGSNAQLSKRGSNAKTRSRSLVSTAGSGSGGISTSSLSRNTGGSGGSAGGNIDGVQVSRVNSDIGTAVADARPLSDGPGLGRSDEEIQIVFDRYKAALYRIYNRELRKNPTLQGQMILRLTIEPNGSVSMCQVDSTDMNSAALVADIIARVKRFNFGAKANVPAITILYPIDFLPAS